MEQIINAPETGAPAVADLIKDTSTATFMDDVVQASMETPVVVDLWAPWCGPCKQLGPVLEKVVTEARGAVKLVKLNIDENPEIAQQMRVQSIPAVFAFFGGRPMDGFAGALPESQVKEFIDRVVESAGTKQDSPIDDALAQADELMEAQDFASAGAIYTQVVEHDSGNVAAMAGLVRCLTATGDMAKAREVVSQIPEDKRGEKDIAAAISALELAERAADVGDLQQLRDKVAANTSDHQARFDLALALYAADLKEEAIEALVEIIRRDRIWNDEAARKELLELFEAIGAADPITVSGRRKLSAVLFS